MRGSLWSAEISMKTMVTLLEVSNCCEQCCEQRTEPGARIILQMEYWNHRCGYPVSQNYDFEGYDFLLDPRSLSDMIPR